MLWPGKAGRGLLKTTHLAVLAAFACMAASAAAQETTEPAAIEQTQTPASEGAASAEDLMSRRLREAPAPTAED